MPADEKDQNLLKELRANWDEDDEAWSEIRKAGDDDIACLTGGIWGVMDPDGAKQRTTAKRPMIDTDEMNQYCNQVINDLRANKRGIKVTAMGNGATDQTARWRQGKIRDIEYRSNSHQAYTTLAENSIQRGYGWMRLVKKYMSDESFDQELLIEPVLNPNSVTPDAYAVKSDGKDLRRVWVRETRTIAEFKREFPDAKIIDFGAETQRLAPKWVHGTTIDIAECWVKSFLRKRTRIAIAHPDGQSAPLELWKDEEVAKGITSDQILKQRDVDQFQVMQYLTNGVEILQRTKWDGKSIPFVPSYGKIMYVSMGGTITRILLSLIRLARSPQMLMNYLGTCEAEMVGMTPKFPYFFYNGSLTPAALDLLARSLHEPIAGIPVEPIIAGMPAGQPPPFPIRNPWDAAAIQQLELLRESARRAIQAAIGASPLPTQAQRHNEKSGVALKQIEDTAQKGSFHFVDHYDEAIARMGELISENLGSTYDTARTTSIRQANDEPAQVRINDPSQRYTPDLEPSTDPQHTHIDTGLGDHDVTISVGPRAESERDAASDFADQLVGNQVIPQIVGPQKAQKLLAAGIRLKNLGPIGDEMADIIDPKDQHSPQQAQQQLAEMHGKMQQMGQQMQQLVQEHQAKTLELASKEKIASMEIQSRETMAALDRETKITAAELGAKVDRMQLFLDERARIGAQMADAQQAQADRSHEIVQSEVEHQQGLAAGAQAHSQALEQGQAGVQGQIAVQAAAPPPTNGGANA